MSDLGPMHQHVRAAWEMVELRLPFADKGSRVEENIVTARIQVEELAQGEFQVRVIEGTTESSHRVTLKSDEYNQLASGKVEPQELVRKSFEFLLEHEPKESILARFDLRDIGRYFPNFEGEIKRRLSR